MPIPNLSRPGQVNAANAVDALFLKQFSGEVMTAFEQANVMIPLTTVRTITNGKSAQFPSVGIAQAGYHTPGTDLLDNGAFTGTSFKQAEATITIDDLLVSTTFIPEIEELENHYDVRSIYSTEMGRALAYTADKQLIQLAAKAATAANAINDDHPLPNRPITDTGLANATLGTAVEAFIGACYTAAARFDAVNIPKENRYCIVNPDAFYKLYRSGITDVAKAVLLNKDINGGGNGTLGMPSDSLEIAGIKVLKSNHTPYADLSTAGNDGDNVNTGPAKYQIDAQKIVTTFFTTQAIGTLKLMDLSMQSEYRIDRQGTLLVARYAMGHGILRPECAINLQKAA
jgi:hypothetical protein